MKKKRDLVLVLSVLVIAALLFGITRHPQRALKSGGQIWVYVNGQLHTQSPLRSGESITIRQADDAINTLTMTETGFYMSHSTCRSQSCIRQGEVNAENFTKRTLGTHILCLPHRIDAELVLTNASEPASIVPDV